eukprot:NODE_83_length_22457_cov_0.375794.p15 type:complete len:109 gc:universal NODE_83_length_22457_cov_0.375794:9298-8972(-)
MARKGTEKEVQYATLKLVNDVKVKVLRFNGTNENLILWWNTFIHYKDWGEWTEKVAVLKCVACLEGQALRLVQQMKIEELTLDKIRETLKSRYIDDRCIKHSMINFGR